jgi:hypothetical protein
MENIPRMQAGIPRLSAQAAVGECLKRFFRRIFQISKKKVRCRHRTPDWKFPDTFQVVWLFRGQIQGAVFCRGTPVSSSGLPNPMVQWLRINTMIMEQQDNIPLKAGTLSPATGHMNSL